MPIIKSAKKKLRKDRSRALQNEKIRKAYKSMLIKAKKTKSKEDIKRACQAIDKAAKRRVIHKNKAARLKSALAHGSKN